jgi:hypothetical protein
VSPHPSARLSDHHFFRQAAICVQLTKVNDLNAFKEFATLRIETGEINQRVLHGHLEAVPRVLYSDPSRQADISFPVVVNGPSEADHPSAGHRSPPLKKLRAHGALASGAEAYKALG